MIWTIEECLSPQLYYTTSHSYIDEYSGPAAASWRGPRYLDDWIQTMSSYNQRWRRGNKSDVCLGPPLR